MLNNLPTDVLYVTTTYLYLKDILHLRQVCVNMRDKCRAGSLAYYNVFEELFNDFVATDWSEYPQEYWDLMGQTRVLTTTTNEVSKIALSAPHLEELQFCHASYLCFSSLSRLQKLHTLILESVTWIEPMPQLPRLKSLTVDDSHYFDNKNLEKHLRALLRCVPQLEYLRLVDLSGFYANQDQVNRVLAQFTKLRELHLVNLPFRIHHLDCFANMPNLRVIRLECLPFLKTVCHLRGAELVVENCNSSLRIEISSEFRHCTKRQRI